MKNDKGTGRRLFASAWRQPLYLAVLGPVAVLDAYVSTHFAVPVATVVRPALATAAALILIGGAAGWLMGRHRGPALASIAGACLLVDMPSAGPEIAAILLPVGVVVLDRFLRIRGRILPWASVTRGMNAFAVVLVALALLQWANSGGLSVLGLTSGRCQTPLRGPVQIFPTSTSSCWTGIHGRTLSASTSASTTPRSPAHLRDWVSRIIQAR